MGGRVVESSADLVAGRPRNVTIWTPRAPELIAGHPGVIEDLCVADPRNAAGRMDRRYTYPARQLHYARLAEVALFTRLGCAMPRPGVVLIETMSTWTIDHAASPAFAGLQAGRPQLQLRHAMPQRRLTGRTMSLCHVCSVNYGHWLTESLVAIPDIIDCLVDGSLRLVTPPLLPWQRRTLELLAVPRHAIEEVEEPVVLCADLVCHSYSSPGHAMLPSAALRAVFQRLAAAAPRDPSITPPRFIFVARRDVPSWRRLVNEAEVEAALAELGFATVRPETLSVDEQIATFASAEIVVGAHGSGLSNVGFSPAGCVVVDITVDGGRFVETWRMTRLLGQRFVYVAGQPDPRTMQPVEMAGAEVGDKYDFRVDTGAVVRTIRAVMDRLAPERKAGAA